MPKNELKTQDSYAKINTFTAESAKRISDDVLSFGERYPYEIAAHFDSDISEGLRASQVKRLRAEYGSNIVTKPPELSFASSIKKQLKNLITMFLLFSSIIMYFFNDDPFYVLMPLFVFLMLPMNAILEQKAGKHFARLYKISSPRVTVVRDGRQVATDSRAIVAGDIIVLESGNIVPADARLIESASLVVLETPVSGVGSPTMKDARFLSKNKSKTVCENMVYAGSIVISGNATAIVCEVGKNVLINRMRRKSDKVNLPHLLSKTQVLGNLMSIIVVLLQTLLILAGFFFDIPIATTFIIALALGCVYLSDTLFSLSAIAFGSTIINALDDGAAIKNLDIVEKLSSIDTIMCDKNTAFPLKRIRVDSVYANLQTFEVARSNKPMINEILRLTILCSSVKEKIKEKRRKKTMYSDQFEANIFTHSLLNTMNDLGITYDDAKKDFHRIEAEFDSRGDICRVLCLLDGYTMVIVKGTPENILSRCSGYRKDGVNYKFNDRVLQNIRDNAAEISKTQVPVAIAAGFTSADSLRDITVERKLVFIGFVGFYTSTEMDSASAVHKCSQAGIQAVVSSEDSYYTALNLAKNAGIITSNAQICTKEMLDTTEEGLFIANSSNYKVFLNLTDDDWLYIMRLRHLDKRRIAVSASRTEQLPLMKEADVSFVTVAGTSDTVRHTGDVQMLDHGFDTIVTALKNAKLAVKRITMLNDFMPAGFLMMFFWIFISAIIGGNLPLRMQDIMIFGLLINTMLMYSLAFTPMHRHILKESYFENAQKKPYSSYLFTLGYSFFGAIICYISASIGERNNSGSGITTSMVTFFALLVFYAMMCGLGKNIIVNRIYKNYRYLTIALLGFAIVNALIYIPRVARFFDYVRLTPIQMLTSLGIPLVYLIIIQIIMTIINKNQKGVNYANHKNHADW